MHSINFDRWTKVIKRKISKLSPTEEFIFHLTNLVGTPYVWGGETPLGTDCSGTICYALWMMGYNIRTNAQGLFDHLFTYAGDESPEESPHAMFYQTERPRHHGDREVPAGTIIHVAPIVGSGVVLNAGEAVSLEHIHFISDYFDAHNATGLYRALNWDAAEKISSSGNHAWNIDPILSTIRS